MTALLLAVLALSAGGPSSDDFPLPRDAEYQNVLEILYNGGTDTALTRLAKLGRRYPDDPAGSYLEALALCWKIEEMPSVTELDAELERRVERTLDVAEQRLRRNPRDLRARLGRAGAFGVASRHALFRGQELRAAREAVRMREVLLDIQRDHPDLAEVRFGLGLYDYYADVLPRALKVLRFVAGFPGGDRERGLELIRSARKDTVFHRVEAQVQLFEIYSAYENRPEAARDELADLHRRYPESPLWALQLISLLRDELGDYAGSVRVADEVLAAAQGGHPHFGKTVEAMAGLGKAHALILDLRLDEAEKELDRIGEPATTQGRLSGRRELLVGQCAELRGDRHLAVSHYQRAAQSSSRSVGREALEALRRPLAEETVKAMDALAKGRRAYEANDLEGSAMHYARALELWPRSPEAHLGLAEVLLACGRVEEATRQLDDVPATPKGPPWLTPWRQLLWAWVLDSRGERAAAENAYDAVVGASRGRPDLERRALESQISPLRGAAACPYH